MKKLHFLMIMLICAAFTAIAQQKVSNFVRPEVVQYQKSFTMDGKKYTMYWVYRDKDIRPNSLGVSDIYLVPSDYKPINPLYRPIYDDNCPPYIQKLILHDVPGKEFLEAYVREIKCDKNGENQEAHEYGVRLPDDIANEIVDLACGDTKFGLNQMLTRFGETKSEALSPLKVTKFR